MSQAIHIFRKDVRHLWREILILLFATAAFSFQEIVHALRWSDLVLPQGQAREMALILMTLAAWVLIIRVIHAEALPGDRQFWLTRPYDWRSLLGAKVIFILTFVNAPLFLSDSLILSAYGFPFWSSLPGLLWRQLLRTAALELPIAAFAAVTAGLVQLVFAILVLMASLVAYTMSSRAIEFAGPLDWVRSTCVVVVTVVVTVTVLALQYAARRTMLSRSLVAAGWTLVVVVESLIPWTTAFAIQARSAKQPVAPAMVHAGLYPGRNWTIHAEPAVDGYTEVSVPLQVSGIPDGMEAKAEGVTFAFEGAQQTWRFKHTLQAAVPPAGMVFVVKAAVDGADYRKFREQTIRIRGTLYLTLFGGRRAMSVPFNGPRVSTPEAGACSASQGAKQEESFVLCRYPFRSPPRTTSIYFADFKAMTFRPGISYSPFPAELSPIPVSVYFANAYQPPRPRYGYPPDFWRMSLPEVVTTEPLAFIRPGFEATGVRLADFEK